ncbi:hypothetical protein ACQPW3_15875 [Actinosynnema sp. CA-248983]
MKHRALAASAATLAANAVSMAAVAAPQAQPLASLSLDLSAANRRAPLPGLPDWSKAGYRGLPTGADHTSNAACRITPEELAALGVTLTGKPYNGTLTPGASTDSGFGLPLNRTVNGSPR